MKSHFLFATLAVVLLAQLATAQSFNYGVPVEKGDISGFLALTQTTSSDTAQIAALVYWGGKPNIFATVVVNSNSKQVGLIGIGTGFKLPIKSLDVAVYPTVIVLPNPLELAISPTIIGSKTWGRFTPFIDFAPSISDDLEFNEGYLGLGANIELFSGFALMPEVFKDFSGDFFGAGVALSYTRMTRRTK